MTPCLFCDGTGSIQIDDFTTKQCRCAYRRELAAHIGAELANSPHVEDGSLYVYGSDPSKPEIDKTRSNVFIRGRWRDILPHVKWALIARGTSFYTRIATDLQLKDVYVGSTSAKVKKNGSANYESMSDFVGEDWDLVIIRLGVSNSNRALPGIIQETLLMRQVSLKPTWLIDDPDQNRYWYNDDLREFLTRNNYEVIEISSSPKSQTSPTPHIETSPKVVEKILEPSPKPHYDDALAELGLSEEVSRKKKNKWPKRY